MERCGWCLLNELMTQYHDEEWGVPLYDDRKQFEFLMMEVMQCGLNWNMMLQKREIFHACFTAFDYEAVARYEERDIERILNTPGMIRSRRKIEAVIHNAQRFMEIRKEFLSSAGIFGVLPEGRSACTKDMTRANCPHATSSPIGSAET